MKHKRDVATSQLVCVFIYCGLLRMFLILIQLEQLHMSRLLEEQERRLPKF